MGLTPQQIGELSLWKFNEMYRGFAEFNGAKDDSKEKAPSKKRLEQVYKDLGVWYPEIMEAEKAD